LNEALAEQEWGRLVLELTDFQTYVATCLKVTEVGKDTASALFLRKKHALLEADLQVIHRQTFSRSSRSSLSLSLSQKILKRTHWVFVFHINIPFFPLM
jgi:hypothetical protein